MYNVTIKIKKGASRKELKMTLLELKKLFKTMTVNAWFEAGTDVVAVGDKMITRGERFSRLDMYEKAKALQFCNEKQCAIPCGEVTFSNGQKIFYNIKK